MSKSNNKTWSPYFLRQALYRACRGLMSAGSSLLTPADHCSPVEALARMNRAGAGGDCPHDGEEPIFLLATGWRTGSTLVQRVLSTDKRLALWGEPYGDLNLINRLCEAVSGYHEHIAPESVILRARAEDLSDKWIANLFPAPYYLRRALQSQVFEWLARPAYDLRYERWGMKEVRLGYPEAALLHWLFPRAKFLVVTRNPYQAYNSALQLGPVWDRHPDRRVADAFAYGTLWNRLVIGWKAAPAAFPHRLIQLEKIEDGSVDFAETAAFCQLDLEPEAAVKNKIGASRRRRALNGCDRGLITTTTRPGREWLGYRG